MSKANLKKDEKDLLKGFESGEFKSKLSDKRKEFLKAAVQNTEDKGQTAESGTQGTEGSED